MSSVDFAATQARVTECSCPHTCYQSRSIQFAKVLFQSWIAWCKYILASSKLGSILMASLKSSTASLYLPADILGNIFHLNAQQTVVKGTVSHYCACTKFWFSDRMLLIQKMRKEKENLEKSFCIVLGWVRFNTKTSQNYRSMIILFPLSLDLGEIRMFGYSLLCHWLEDQENGSTLIPVEGSLIFSHPLPYKLR